MNISESLISGIRSFCSRDFSQDEMHQLKRCVLDWLGVSMAGASVSKGKLDTIVNLSKGGNCTTFVSDKNADVLTAAFLNGFVAHEMELDDGHRFGMLHLAAPIISAMVALAQQENIDFPHFAKGVMAGYQVTVKLAKLIQPYHKKCGFHATGTCGTMGVAAAAAIAMDFSDEQFLSALGAAGTRAAGLLAAIDAPSELKPYNIAGAVETGLLSAYLSKAGFVGPDDPLVGERGFLKVYAPETKPNLGSFDDIPEILNIYFKPYVSCRHCHAPAEAALYLKEQYNLQWREIREIKVGTYRLAIAGHDSKEINSVGAAKMSIPYCVAISLFRGSCGLDSFTEDLVSNNDVKAITRLVNVVENEDLTRLSPGKRGAIVSISTNKGESYSRYVENPLGEPENPMSDQMLEEKYWELVSFAGVDRPRAEMMRAKIWNLESEFKEFLGLL